MVFLESSDSIRHHLVQFSHFLINVYGFHLSCPLLLVVIENDRFLSSKETGTTGDVVGVSEDLTKGRCLPRRVSKEVVYN